MNWVLSVVLSVTHVSQHDFSKSSHFAKHICYEIMTNLINQPGNFKALS